MRWILLTILTVSITFATLLLFAVEFSNGRIPWYVALFNFVTLPILIVSCVAGAVRFSLRRTAFPTETSLPRSFRNGTAHPMKSEPANDGTTVSKG